MGNYIQPTPSGVFTGGTIYGVTEFLTGVTMNALSATTLSAGTLYSGTTNLYDIFITAADGNDITRLANGLNTYTGGTVNLPTINISAVTLDNITVSGTSTLTTLSAETLTAITVIVSGLINTGNTIVVADSGGTLTNETTLELSSTTISSMTVTSLTATTLYGNVISSLLQRTSDNGFQTGATGVEFYSPEQHGSIYGTVYRRYYTIPDAIGGGDTVMIELGFDLVGSGGKPIDIRGMLEVDTPTSRVQWLTIPAVDYGGPSMSLEVNINNANQIYIRAGSGLDWNNGVMWVDYTLT